MRKLGRKCTSALLALALFASVLPIVAAPAQAERSGTEDYSINYDEGTTIKSDAELGNLTVSGQTGFQGHFQYGDTITVTFTPERQASTSTKAQTLAENTATLTYTPDEGEKVTLATATAQADGSFKLTYDTQEKKLPIGENLTLTVSYGGSGEFNPVQETVTLSLDKAILMNVPSVSGNFVYGETLTVNYTKQDDETVTYQWYRVGSVPGGETIAGVTGPEYKLTEADIGNHIYVNVRATDDWHRGLMQSTNQDVVAKAPGSIAIACNSVTVGTAVSPIVTSTTNTGATVTYSYSGTGSTSYGPSSEPPTAAGSYTVTATVAETATHTAAESDSVAFTISEAEQSAPEPPYTGKYSYEVTTSVGDNGTISVDRYATEGDKVTIEVSPDEAYLLEALTITSGGKDVEVTAGGDGTYTFTMPSGDVRITATFAEDPDWTEPEEPTTDVSEIFLDIAPDAWYRDAVQYAYDNGLMTGVSATEFAPEATTTRAMIVSILARLENVTSAESAGFADVNDEWYATAVNWAASVGVVSATGDGNFSPNAAITREQLAAMLMNYAAYKGEDVSARADLSAYSDQPSAWAKETMSWAVAEGLLTGVTADELQPQGNATRAQVAAILQRYLGA